MLLEVMTLNRRGCAVTSVSVEAFSE